MSAMTVAQTDCIGKDFSIACWRSVFAVFVIITFLCTWGAGNSGGKRSLSSYIKKLRRSLLYFEVQMLDLT